MFKIYYLTNKLTQTNSLMEGINAVYSIMRNKADDYAGVGRWWGVGRDYGRYAWIAFMRQAYDVSSTGIWFLPPPVLTYCCESCDYLFDPLRQYSADLCPQPVTN